MDAEECGHQKINEGICLECGRCFEFFKLENEWTQITSSTACASQMKYIIKDSNKLLEKKIDKILIPLELISYKEQIKELFHIKVFKSRLKSEDKIIVIIYHLLKQNSFPISLSDLLPYTSLSKYKILKAHRDTFEFKKPTTEYLKGIYDRNVAFLKKYGVQSKCDLKRYLYFCEIFITVDPKALCLALLLECADGEIRKIKDTAEYNANQIKNIKRKIRPYSNVISSKIKI